MAITQFHAYIDDATEPTLWTVGKEITQGEDGALTAHMGPFAANSKHSLALAAFNGLEEGPKTDVLSVTTSAIPVTGITIKIAATMTVGQSLKATITIEPTDATDKSVTYKSSDVTIATVAADGTVKALKAGSVTITVTTASGKTATATITIYEALVTVTGLKATNVTATGYDVTWTTTAIAG